jgi:hypothetical protein
MMFSFKTCHFVIFSLLSLSANAETVRGAQRELGDTDTVNLGLAGEYAILSKTGVSTVPTSDITGDIGVSPAAATFLTGFALTLDSGGQYSTTTQVDGGAHSASYGGVVATRLTSAVSSMEAAYTDAASRTTVAAKTNLGSGGLGGVYGGPAHPLTTGVYKFGSSVTVGSTIHFSGSATDIFIIQMTGDLLVQASVILDGPVLPENIFWQVAGKVTVESKHHMQGIILAATAVTFETESRLTGRVLTQTHCALDMARITQA